MFFNVTSNTGLKNDETERLSWFEMNILKFYQYCTGINIQDANIIYL